MIVDGIELPALKPCPFCNCEMTWRVFQQHDGAMGTRTFYAPVALKHHDGLGAYCPGESGRGAASVEAAKVRWNTRNGVHDNRN